MVFTVRLAPELTLTVSLAFGWPPAPDPPVRALQFTVPEAVTVAAHAEEGARSNATRARRESLAKELIVSFFIITELEGWRNKAEALTS